jgi:hypothetical protein
MSAEPTSRPGWDGPAEILALLPRRWHEQFLSEYQAALEAARDVRQWRRLAELLTRWQLRAVAYSDPGFDGAAKAARDARAEDLHPVPGMVDWQ